MRGSSPFAWSLIGVSALGAVFVYAVQTEPTRFLARQELRWGIHIEPGDVVFQDLQCGPRCDLIREVTHSRYTHVGIVLDEDGDRVVWEAFRPVGRAPLADWVQRGRDKLVAVYRWDAASRDHLPAIAREVRAMRGLPYDGDYQWDDDRIYCSELIAKAAQRATGHVLFEPHPSGPGSFGANAGLIRQMSKGRLTEQTPLVSPWDLTRSAHLTRVVDELAAMP